MDQHLATTGWEMPCQRFFLAHTHHVRRVQSVYEVTGALIVRVSREGDVILGGGGGGGGGGGEAVERRKS